jgi:hypothetical protein
VVRFRTEEKYSAKRIFLLHAVVELVFFERELAPGRAPSGANDSESRLRRTEVKIEHVIFSHPTPFPSTYKS